MYLPGDHNQKKRKQHLRRNQISFSACLPEDVHAIYAHSICAVKYSSDPFSDIRESVLEMMETVGVRNWNQLEELVYCYIALNPSEVHQYIEQAFVSVFISRAT
ncbi:Transcription repressor [Heracleum sosnowskyi]|uniref:Transcription repressor n=1 Tax=Heracleum sosnowskyi TaxID=360622 RepID=A0AAD8J8E7_9APIA|nr:Transcription repressor [Heracleum sosnowskyi]